MTFTGARGPSRRTPPRGSDRSGRSRQHAHSQRSDNRCAAEPMRVIGIATLSVADTSAFELLPDQRGRCHGN